MDPQIQAVAWKPTPRQAEFLAAPDFEVLFGGSAGGGKSDGLLIDAAGLSQNALAEPDYRAILLRRSFPELRDLIDRSQLIYPIVDDGAKYNHTEKVWTFTSGAKIELNFLKREQDRFLYQGRAFAYGGFDELTQYATDAVYRYMLSRIRTANPRIRPYARATCNPGGVGHEWVKDHWAINDAGEATRFKVDVEMQLTDGSTVKRTITRRFIPARLGDNPYLASTDYLSNLLQLPEMERRALLEGRWDVTDIPGQIYREEIEKAVIEQRFTRVPIVPRLPVNTFWDLGHNDSTAIWFHQRVGSENRFIDYYEDSLTGLATYVRVLKDKGYLFGDHYLPFDADVTELGTGKSRKAMLEESGIKPVIVVPRIENRADGIEMVRDVFSSCLFDTERCADGIAALKAYRYEWNERQQVWRRDPLHDWASNGADAFRMFAQAYRAKTLTRVRRNDGRAAQRENNWRAV
ncbi:terminase [Dokdonella soli]